MTPWFDTHVHLDWYRAPDQAALLGRAVAAGVRVIAVAEDLRPARRFEPAPGLAGYLVGVHPLRAATEALPAARAGDAMVVGIGECGFDAAAGDFQLQATVFRAHCGLARELGLPLVLHLDGASAWDAFLAEDASIEGLTVVRHYFAGDATQAAWHAERGHFLSFGNPLRRREDLQAIARGYPADRLLIETDSYPLPGRATEPHDVIRVGDALAQARGWTVAQAREQLATNTAAAFPKLLEG